MHEVEKRMLASDFEAEAMEGFESIDSKHIPDDLDQLRQRIDQRTGDGQTRLTFWIKIAASIAILAISTFVILNLDLKNDRQKITQLPEKAPPLFNDSSARENAAADRTSDSLLALHEEPKKEEQPEAVKEPSSPTRETTTPNSAPAEQKAELKPDEHPTERLAFADVHSKKIQPIIIAEEADAITLKKMVEEDVEVISKTMVSDEVSALQQEIKNARISQAFSDQQAKKRRLNRAAAAAMVMPAEDKNTKTITGTVTAAEDGSVLPGVNITVKGTSTGTITDIDGHYALTIPDSVDAVLVASLIGMKNEEIKPGEKTTVDLQLDTDLIALSEVVVIGYGTEKGVTTDVNVRASPADGWSNFKKYIKNNRHYPSDTVQVKGRVVVVDFEVTADGKPVNFKIIRSLGHSYDREAIRLIQEGPAWNPATRNGIPEQDKVRIRIRFNQ